MLGERYCFHPQDGNDSSGPEGCHFIHCVFQFSGDDRTPDAPLLITDSYKEALVFAVRDFKDPVDLEELQGFPFRHQRPELDPYRIWGYTLTEEERKERLFELKTVHLDVRTKSEFTRRPQVVLTEIISTPSSLYSGCVYSYAVETAFPSSITWNIWDSRPKYFRVKDPLKEEEEERDVILSRRYPIPYYGEEEE